MDELAMPRPEHSPAPFRIVKWHTWHEIRDANDRVVADTLTREEDEREAANLALFAAAPDLLRACEAYLEVAYELAWNNARLHLRGVDDETLRQLAEKAELWPNRRYARRVLELRTLVERARGITEAQPTEDR
jgi:hypothetical protein